VDASVETVAGEIRAAWKKGDGTFRYNVSIPANTSATVVLPVSGYNDFIITEGGTPIWEKDKFTKGEPGIEAVKKEGGQILISLGSGNFDFRITAK
jgi:alpha-L-rhamnosidase